MLKLYRWRHLGRRGRVLSIDGEISVRDTGQKESTRLKVTGKKDNLFFSFLSRKTNKQINQKIKNKIKIHQDPIFNSLWWSLLYSGSPEY